MNLPFSFFLFVVFKDYYSGPFTLHNVYKLFLGIRFMNKRGISVVFCIIFLFSFVYFASASEISGAKVDVLYFHGIGCPHCANVAASGVLERVGNLSNVNMTSYEVYYDQKGRDKLIEMQDLLGIPEKQRGIPFAVVNCSGKYLFYAGDDPIINDLMSSIGKCPTEGIQPISIDYQIQVTFFTVIFAALVDSINPCAFGVLIFLMISLLKMGSAKRAFRAGMVYSVTVFITYFLSGLGIFKVIQAMSGIGQSIYLVLGLFVFVFAILEFVDYFRAGNSDKSSILKIPKSVKPLLEKITHKGTIPAMIVLGFLVSMFELPCTGGIYVAILTSMALEKSFAIGYLILYNLIFVLPLVIITLMIYKGISPERLQTWNAHEKKWMKLAAAVVLLALAGYIFKLAGVF